MLRPDPIFAVREEAARTEITLALSAVDKASAARPETRRAAEHYGRAAELAAKAVEHLRAFEAEARRRAGGGTCQ